MPTSGNGKTLTARVDFDITAAEKKIQKLTKMMNKIDNTANNSGNVGGKITKQNEAFNKSLERSNNLVGSLWKKLKGVAAAYGGIMGMRTLITTSDVITSAENKLNALNGGDAELTQQTMDKMYASAQKTRMAYADMMKNVSKSMTLAPDAFGGNIDNAIRFQEIMSEAYTIGGASAAEMSSSMYQLIQGLGSGILQGDELRSVREGAPVAYKAIEKFAQGIYGAEENLKDLASQGKITSDIVVAAIMGAGDEMDAKFEDTAMTFAQAWTKIKNTATKAFEPVLQKMNELLNKMAEMGVFEAIEKALLGVRNAAYIVILAFEALFTFVANNWSWLQWIIYTGIAVIIGALGVMAGRAIIAWLSTYGVMLGWIIIIGVIIAAIIQVAKASKTGCEFVYAVMLSLVWAIIALIGIVLIYALLTGTFLIGIPMLIVLAVIAAIALIIAAIAYAGEEIFGVVAAAISVIWNLFVTLLAFIIQRFLTPITLAIDNFANFFGNIFTDPIATIIRMFESLATSVLGILKTIASGIDAIFGGNLANTVQGWIDGVSGKADDLVAKYGNGKYEEKSDLTGKLGTMVNDAVNKFTWDTSLAYEQGAGVGRGVQDGINNLFDKAKNGLSSFDLNDTLSTALGLDTSLPTIDTAGLNADDPTKVLGGIKDDTGGISDSLDLTNEDLQHLRDLANREWKKEFTTANIKVDMNNTNTINNKGDLDGWVEQLTDRLYEELDSVANGVYA